MYHIRFRDRYIHGHAWTNNGSFMTGNTAANEDFVVRSIRALRGPRHKHWRAWASLAINTI